MKKNIYALLLLLGLLIFTYYYQELGQYRREQQPHQQSALLKGDTQELQEVRFDRFSILLAPTGASKIKPSGLPVDQKRFDQFLQQLSYIKVQRELDLSLVAEDEQLAITSGFKHRLWFFFNHGERSYQLGGKLPLAQSFYLRTEERGARRAGATPQGASSKTLICVNSAPRLRVYNPQNQADSGPYLELAQWFATDESAFHQLNVFEQLPPITWVEVEGGSGQKFELAMEKLQTTPAIYLGLDYAPEEFQQFYHRLKNLRAQRIFPLRGRSKDLRDRLSSLKWQGVLSGQLQLFGRYRQREGYFVVYRDVVYELGKNSAQLFFYHVQDFWLKRPFGRTLDDQTALVFTLRHGQRQQALQIPLSREFRVEVLGPAGVQGAGPRPSVAAFRQLFRLLFGSNSSDNRGPGQQAQRVQGLTDEIKHLFARKAPVVLELLGRRLLLLSHKEEVLLWDQSSNVIFHYLVGPHFALKFAWDDFFD